VAELPIELPEELASQLASCLDAEGKIARALDALGPLEGRDVVLLDAESGLRARQLVALGARLTLVAPAAGIPRLQRALADLLDEGGVQRLVADEDASSALSEASSDAVVSLWSGFRQSRLDEVAEADRVLRRGGRLLVVHDYGRDDVSRLRDANLPEYGAWSRRDGWFLQNGFKLRVIHCWWTWQDVPRARAFLEDTFGELGKLVGGSMRRPRLSYNIAIYHRPRGGQAIEQADAALAGRA
jgi:hypothetical protein